MIDFITKGMENPSLFSVFAGYIGGVLSSLTPCIYPMIPIVVSVVGGSSQGSKIRGLTLSISYTLGLSIIYTALGIFAAVTGGFFGEVATHPWSYIVFGNVCIVLGLWMMDWISIPLFPSHNREIRGGHMGVFIAGIFSGLVVAPCTSPVLAGILLYVSGTKDVYLGGSILLAFSLGMSTLLVLIGTFSGAVKSLPRPGAWMVWVKRGLALSLLLYGEYLLIKAGGLLI